MSFRRAFPLLAAWLTLSPAALAQTTWNVDPKLSLAWWQVVPHLGHLWSTTCPAEKTWQPGEGRGGAWTMDEIPNDKNALDPDTNRVPQHPRPVALPVCRKAVEGRILVVDSVRWEGIRGDVSVKVAMLATGNRRRDEYASRTLLQSNRHEEIRFIVDSVAVTNRMADTLAGTAHGVLTLLGVSQPTTAMVRAWPEAGGMRVLARFHIPAHDLVPVYGMSKLALGLGVGLKIWEYVFGGIDVVLVPERS